MLTSNAHAIFSNATMLSTALISSAIIGTTLSPVSTLAAEPPRSQASDIEHAAEAVPGQADAFPTGGASPDDPAEPTPFAVLAGWENGKFFLKSEDNNYRFEPNARVQVRYVFNQQDRDDPSADETGHGFEIKRFWFGAKGHVYDPSWQYGFLMGFGRDGDFELEDAYIRKTFDNGWMVQAGQFKVPFTREFLLTNTKLQFVERSLLDDESKAGRSQGIMVGWKNDQWKADLMFHDGAKEDSSPWEQADTDYAFAGRVEWKPVGDWKQVSDTQAWSGKGDAVLIGAAFNVQQGDFGFDQDALPEPGEAEVQEFAWTFDGLWKFDNANINGAIVGRHRSGDTDSDLFGVRVGGGVFVTEQLELVGQYEWGDADLDGEDNLSILTGGANYFFKKHQVRLSADLGYAFNGVSGTWATAGAGWRSDDGDNDGQIVGRVQMQLYF